MELDFVRDAATVEQFDGWWQVWLGAEHFGRVRDSRGRPGSTMSSRPWGYESVPFGEYPNGVAVLDGFPDRRAAAAALIVRVREGRP